MQSQKELKLFKKKECQFAKSAPKDGTWMKMKPRVANHAPKEDGTIKLNKLLVHVLNVVLASGPLYRRHSKSNQRIKITMTITTVLPFLFGLV